jgi:hypothetical protein
MFDQRCLYSHEQEQVNESPMHGKHLKVNVHKPNRVRLHVFPNRLDRSFKNRLRCCLTLGPFKVVDVELEIALPQGHIR